MADKITSRRNEKVVYMKKLGASASFRREQREFLCDGEKLLAEAVANGITVKIVFACDKISVKLPAGTEFFEVSRDIIENVSPMKTPQSVVFSCEMPHIENNLISGQSIILENVQDPGNVGTVIRTANAFGIDNVILVGACADMFSAKTARASMGAIFRQRIVTMSLEQFKEYVNSGVPVYAAALDETSCDMRNIDLSNASVAIGSEGQGLSKEFLDICKNKIIIPMNPQCESLNAAAAAAVLMWEMGKNTIGEIKIG